MSRSSEPEGRGGAPGGFETRTRTRPRLRRGRSISGVERTQPMISDDALVGSLLQNFVGTHPEVGKSLAKGDEAAVGSLYKYTGSADKRAQELHQNEIVDQERTDEDPEQIVH